MDMQWCLACNKQFDSKQFDNELGVAFASYCSIECMSREQLPLSPAPHAINARLRARFEGPSPVGWSRQVKEPRSRSMSRARPRASTTVSRPPVIQIGFDAEDRAPTPDSEVAWSLPAAGATRLVGSKWMGKDYEGIKCWAHGVRGYPEDDLSDDDFSDISEVQRPIFPIALKAPSLSRSASRRAPTSSALSITPKHMSVFTIDDTASLATPVTDNCLVQGYVESYVQSNTPPQAAHHLRRFMTGSSPQPVSTPKPKERTAQPVPASIPKSPVEPVLIARSQQMSLRPDARAGRDWGGLYDDCEKEQLASDCIGSYIPTTDKWQHRGRTRQRAHTDVLHR